MFDTIEYRVINIAGVIEYNTRISPETINNYHPKADPTVVGKTATMAGRFPYVSFVL